MSLTIGSKVALRSGFKMPLLGLGVAGILESNVVSACLAAFETGYRHVDSAQFYRNEAQVGQAVRKSGLKREDTFVTTKILSNNYGSVRQLLDDSLSKFKFDYVDLLLIHDPACGPKNRIEMWKDLLKARDEGKAKTVGVSSFGVRHLQELVDAGLEVPSVNQIELHPFFQQREIVDWCKKHQVVVQAFCPLIRTRHWDNPTLVSIAEKHNKGVGHVLVRWSLQKGFVPLPRSSHAERIKANADVYDFSLSKDEMNRIDALDQGDDGAISWNPTHAP